MISIELTKIRVRWTVEQRTFWILGYILSTCCRPFSIVALYHIIYMEPKKVTGLTTGNVELEFRDFNDKVKGSVIVRVFKSRKIDILAQVVGWTYNFFWTVSFYPQVFEDASTRWCHNRWYNQWLVNHVHRL